MIKKRVYRSGRVVWSFVFDAPRRSGEPRNQITATGFATKHAAATAEAERRLEALKNFELAQQTAVTPKTVRTLLEEFFTEHANRNLGGKTAQRYRQNIAYLSKELLDTAIDDVTPLDLTREWNRLRDAGGHVRGHVEVTRPLSAKTVRNIASVISSAFRKAVAWGLAARNPVPDSEKPRVSTPQKIALSVDQQALVLAASTDHLALPMILELAAASGGRRGEVMALRWADIQGNEMRVGRSLSQVGNEICFKEPKTAAGFRTVTLPESTVRRLSAHWEQQKKFRTEFGPTYHLDLDLVVCNPDGSPLKPDSVSAAVSALCRRLKLPKGVSLHTLRHTHGSLLLVGGMELPAVSARLGHSSTHVTAKIYAHALTGRDAEAAKVWERLQRPASPIVKEDTN
ncbi:MAG: site-specific integrase [Bryobacteraceae bacterium]